LMSCRVVVCVGLIVTGSIPAASGGVDAGAANRGILSSVSGGGASRSVRLDRHILVHQFGYRPNDPQGSVIRDPRQGFDANDHFSPEDAYEVRRSDDASVVFTGQPTAWKGGAVQDSSGDRGWWLDFSKVSAPGNYFILDVVNKRRSPTFAI